MVEVILGERRSAAAVFEGTERGERSMERREFGRGEWESESDLGIPLLPTGLLTLGVAGDALFGGVSDKEDLLFPSFSSKMSVTYYISVLLMVQVV